MAFWCNGKRGLCHDDGQCKASCEFFDGDGGHRVDIVTNADRIRAMSDEELAEGLLRLYQCGDMGTIWCDGKAGCIDEYGEIHCDEDKIKACVLRWLQQLADQFRETAKMMEEDDHGKV